MIAFFTMMLVGTVAGVSKIASIRGRQNWPQDEADAEDFVRVIRSIKRDLARKGLRMGGAA